MNRVHLTSEQVTCWMMGERTPSAAAHIAVCRECRDKLQETEDALSGFRVNVRSWSAARMPNQLPRLTGKPDGVRFWARTPSLVYGMATLALAVVTFLWQDHGTRTASQETVTTDAALLRQLDQQVSETVPTPMQPLTQLVGWGERTGDDSGSRSSAAGERYVE